LHTCWNWNATLQSTVIQDAKTALWATLWSGWECRTQKPTFELERSTWLQFLQKTLDGRFTHVGHADARDLKMMILLSQ
jgi:hypothetical protein